MICKYTSVFKPDLFAAQYICIGHLLDCIFFLWRLKVLSQEASKLPAKDM